MGPMVGGMPWAAGGVGAWWLAVLLLLVLLLGLVALRVWARRGAEDGRRPGTAEQLLHERYARGELTRRQYREGLIDVLKGRYVRDEMDVVEYEDRLRAFLREPATGPGPNSGDEAPRPGVAAGAHRLGSEREGPP